MLKQEGKSIDGEKGEGSIDLDTYNPHSPSYMLGQASPTSMEWANAKLCQTAAAGGAGSDDDRICRLTLLLHHARQQMQQRPNATTSLFPVLPPAVAVGGFLRALSECLHRRQEANSTAVELEAGEMHENNDDDDRPQADTVSTQPAKKAWIFHRKIAFWSPKTDAERKEERKEIC